MPGIGLAGGRVTEGGDSGEEVIRERDNLKEN